jgi:hypothetical protein
MASAQATSSAAHPAPGGIKEWFWRGNALERAKTAPKASSLRRERLRRARLAAELADRTIDPAEPLRDGSSVPLAISLYREAAYWALLAHSDATEPPTMKDLVAAGNFPKPALSDDDLATVRATIADKTFVDAAEDRADVVCREADLCQAFVHGLIQSELDAEDQVTTVLVQRWVRVGLVLCVVAAALFMGNSALQHALQGPDLLANKPWHTSSKLFECHPKDMECGGARSAMFFHTNDDDKPWVEFDLGSPQKIARVEVINREDCCLERAVPLVVEVSNDHNTYQEVARRVETFREWETTFPPVSARYLRVKVDRRSTLHLVRVSARAN